MDEQENDFVSDGDEGAVRSEMRGDVSTLIPASSLPRQREQRWTYE